MLCRYIFGDESVEIRAIISLEFRVSVICSILESMLWLRGGVMRSLDSPFDAGEVQLRYLVVSVHYR